MNYLFFILILIYLIFYALNYFTTENFQNYVNPFYKNKSFCSFDKDSKKCKCTYQKDGINIPYNSPASACNYECLNKDEKNCVSKNNQQDNYYCIDGNQCKEYKGSIQNKYISINNCGIDKLTNLLKLPYATKESCESSIKACDKYNDSKLSKSERKKKCLQDTNCGYCSNQFGDGKCVEGTASGPLDLNNNCSANSKTNKYEYGEFLF